MNLQRYSLGGDGYRTPSMIPSPLGEYVKLKDVELLLDEIKLLAQPAPKVEFKVRCGHKVEIEGSRGIAHTYCNLFVGHEGKCV